MKKVIRLKYTGAAPGADSAVYTLFSTVSTAAAGTGSVAAGWPRGVADQMDIATFHYDIKHSQTGTVKGWKSLDGGTNWAQFYDSGSLTAPTYTSNAVVLVEGFRDFKFEWTNAGSAQATWIVDMDISIFP